MGIPFPYDRSLSLGRWKAQGKELVLMYSGTENIQTHSRRALIPLLTWQRRPDGHG